MKEAAAVEIDADGLAGPRLETDTAERLGGALVVGEREVDVLESKDAVADHKLLGAGAVLDPGLEVEDLEEPPAADGGAGERVHHHAELAHGHLQDGHEGQELGQGAHRDLARDHPEAPDPQHQPHGREVRERHDRGVADPDADPLVGERERLQRAIVEFPHLVGLRRERPDHADSAQVLLHHLGQHRHPVLQEKPHPAQLEPRGGRAPGDEGNEAEAEKPENEIGAEQEIASDSDQGREQDDAHETGVEEHAHAFEVEHAAGDQLARVHAVKEAEAQPLKLAIEVHAQPIGDAVADRIAEVVVQHGEQAAERAGDQQ